MTAVYVALDIETTGLDPERDGITEVGAVRFDEDGNVLDTFESLVNPGRVIPLFIENLTGITNEAVSRAPSLVSISADLEAFVGDAPVIGQNIGFDLAFLRREGVVFRAPAIDTTRLSRILLPDRQSRGLMHLAEALNVAAEPHHRALGDALTTSRVFVALLQRATSLPEEQRRQLARFLTWEEPALAEIVAGRLPDALAITEGQIPRLRPAPEYPALVRVEPPVSVPISEVASVYSGARHEVERFEPRGQQLQMVEFVHDAFSRNGHFLIEAGTGVGKSLAYLIPAAIHAIRNGERVVISTNTTALQEQLVRKDIPALRRILVRAGIIQDETDLRASLLKGRSNYLCFRRWMANYGAGLGDPDFARLASSMLLWLPKTETGDRAELNLDREEFITWQRFSAQDTDCLSRPNTFVRNGQCFLQRARKAAESAHIIVVNHSLLLADIASGGSAIPTYERLIVDEAHNLEDTATQQFGGSVSRRLLNEALEGLYRRPGRDQREGGAVALLKALPADEAYGASALEQAVAAASSLLLPSFETLSSLLPPRGEDDRLLITRAIRSSPDWTDVELHWAELDKALTEVQQRAQSSRDAVASTAPIEEPDVLAGEIDTAARKVEDLRRLYAQLMTHPDDDLIVWASRERDGLASLNSAPLDVGPVLREQLFERCTTVVATSATLSAAGDMSYSAKRIGLEDAQTVQLGSPYDYEESTLLAAFTDIPEPNQPGYNAAIARAIITLVTASQGRAMVLFTSHASMREVAGIVRGDLEAEGIVLHVQDVDGPARQIVENLTRNPRSVVFGTSSLWEGVDIRGEALSMLIICRLPFGVPTDPVYKARAAQYQNEFAEYALPSSILRFRQGFGRLIRDKTDRGVVAVLDRRIYEKTYGQRFIEALPPCKRIKADTATVAARAAEWLDR